MPGWVRQLVGGWVEVKASKKAKTKWLHAGQGQGDCLTGGWVDGHLGG